MLYSSANCCWLSRVAAYAYQRRAVLAVCCEMHAIACNAACCAQGVLLLPWMLASIRQINDDESDELVADRELVICTSESAPYPLCEPTLQHVAAAYSYCTYASPTRCLTAFGHRTDCSDRHKPPLPL